MEYVRMGDRTQVVFGPKKVVDANFALVEAAALTPSHDWGSLQPDRRYPRALQGRAYSGAFGRTAAAVVATQVLEPMYVLDPTMFPWGGPPICTDQGLIVAGNHRAILLQRAALRSDDRHVEAYHQYREKLFARLSLWGISTTDVVVLKAPVLVRVLDEAQWTATGSDDREKMLRRLNVLSDRPPTKAYDALSDGFAMATALLDAEDLTSQDMLVALARLIDGPSLRGVLRGSRGYEFVAALTRFGAVTPAEHPSLVNPIAARLSSAGCSRIAWMVRALLVGDRAILASTPKIVLQKLDGSWGQLLASAHGSVGLVVRSRLHDAFETLGAAESGNGSIATYAQANPVLRPVVPDCAILLAQCLSDLRRADVPALLDRWLRTLAPNGAGDFELTFAGFDVPEGRGEAAERAVLEEALSLARRRRFTQVGRRLPDPEEYLSPTEWVALEPHMPPPTARRSPRRTGGRPVLSNKSLAAALVYVFECGATSETVISAWRQLPVAWTTRSLVCRRTTLQRRLARLDIIAGGRARFFAVIADIATSRGRNQAAGSAR